MPSTTIFTLLQLSDGTFPSGGFAHSGGLEALTVLGPSALGIDAFVDASLRNAARATLPYVAAAHRDPLRLDVIDEGYDATLPLASVNYASRAQGRALASAAGRVWQRACGSIARYARTGQEAPAHHGPVLGAISGALGLTRTETAALYLHGVARGLLSSAVRLGIMGPLEAQRLIAERAALFTTLVDRASTIDDTADAAQSAPVIELFAALHDRLDGRMFQS